MKRKDAYSVAGLTALGLLSLLITGDAAYHHTSFLDIALDFSRSVGYYLGSGAIGTALSLYLRRNKD